MTDPVLLRERLFNAIRQTGADYILVDKAVDDVLALVQEPVFRLPLPTDAEVEQWLNNLVTPYPAHAVRLFAAWLRTRAEEPLGTSAPEQGFAGLSEKHHGFAGLPDKDGTR